MKANRHFFNEVITALERHGTEMIPSAEMKSFMDEAVKEQSIELILSSSDGYSEVRQLSFFEGHCEFTGVVPGDYQLNISTGRVLWEGFLSADELIQEADEPLSLAADTGESDQRPTKTISLIPSECDLQVFAGLENGKVRVQTIHE